MMKKKIIAAALTAVILINSVCFSAAAIQGDAPQQWCSELSRDWKKSESKTQKSGLQTQTATVFVILRTSRRFSDTVRIWFQICIPWAKHTAQYILRSGSRQSRK